MKLQITEMSGESEFIYLNVLNSKLDRCLKDGQLDPSILCMEWNEAKVTEFSEEMSKHYVLNCRTS